MVTDLIISLLLKTSYKKPYRSKRKFGHIPVGIRIADLILFLQAKTASKPGHD